MEEFGGPDLLVFREELQTMLNELKHEVEQIVSAADPHDEASVKEAIERAREVAIGVARRSKNAAPLLSNRAELEDRIVDLMCTSVMEKIRRKADGPEETREIR